MAPKRSSSNRILKSALQLLAALPLLWALGFIWFVLTLPGPAPAGVVTDGIVVLTGGPGRTQRGVEMLEKGKARRLLISGVGANVKPAEFQAANNVPKDLFRCCIDLGYVANNTRANAEELADWVRRHNFRSVRLVTTGYHMPRAEAEIRARIGRDMSIVTDAVGGERTLAQMAYEYSKFLAASVSLMAHPARP